jgi:hypothetical protein
MSTQILINGKKFETEDIYLTGKELKSLAGLPPVTELYLSLKRPWEDELVSDDQRVDLSRPEVEYFYVKKRLKFFINNVAFDWDKPYITTEEIRSVGKVDPEQELYNAASPDLPLTSKDRIDLVQSGTDHFVSKKRSVDLAVIVNGRSKSLKDDLITFDQVILLAFGKIDQSLSRAYTVTYSRGAESRPEGIMIKGNEVRVKDKMIFNVTATDKS